MKLEESLERMSEENHPGEHQLKWSLREHGYIVKDVSNNEKYFDKDIDLIATNIFTGVTTTLEVKWCQCISKTGNLFIEIENPRSVQWNGEGWYYHCQADLLAYGDAVNKIFYFIKVSALREYVEKNKEKLSIGRTLDGSVGYKVPKDELTFDCIVQI